MINEYQVGSGLKYLRRLIKKRQPFKYKSISAHKGALKRWRRHYWKMVAGIKKSRASAKGRFIAGSLSRLLKTRNRPLLTGYEPDFLNVLMSMECFKGVQKDLPDLINEEEFVVDLALAMCPKTLFGIQETSYISFVKEQIEGMEILNEDLNVSRIRDVKDVLSFMEDMEEETIALNDDTQIEEGLITRVEFNGKSSTAKRGPSIFVWINDHKYEYVAWPNQEDTEEIHRRLVKMLSHAPAGGRALNWLKKVAVVVSGSKKNDGGPSPEVKVSKSGSVKATGKVLKTLKKYSKIRKEIEKSREKSGKPNIRGIK